jgi:hypothetical protein
MFPLSDSLDTTRKTNATLFMKDVSMFDKLSSYKRNQDLGSIDQSLLSPFKRESRKHGVIKSTYFVSLNTYTAQLKAYLHLYPPFKSYKNTASTNDEGLIEVNNAPIPTNGEGSIKVNNALITTDNTLTSVL